MPDILISDSFKLLKLGREGGTTSPPSTSFSSAPLRPSFSSVSSAILPGGRPGKGFDAFLALSPPFPLPTLGAILVLERREALIAVGVADESFASVLVGDVRLYTLLLLLPLLLPSAEEKSRTSSGERCGLRYVDGLVGVSAIFREGVVVGRPHLSSTTVLNRNWGKDDGQLSASASYDRCINDGLTP